MRHVVFCFVLLLASLGFAQQQPPSTSHPYQTPPTLAGGSQTPREQMPPDMQAPAPKTASAEQVEQQIMQQLSSEPALAHTTAIAKVDEDSVVLTGSVDNEAEHDIAVRIARSYADHRRIADEIKIRQQK